MTPPSKDIRYCLPINTRNVYDGADKDETLTRPLMNNIGIPITFASRTNSGVDDNNSVCTRRRPKRKGYNLIYVSHVKGFFFSQVQVLEQVVIHRYSVTAV